MFDVGLLALVALFALPAVRAQSNALTVYTQYGTGSALTPAQTAICVSAGACDGNVLKILDLPGQDQLTKTATIALASGPNVPGLGHQVKADFVGFSVELSVANQILGNDGNHVNPIFLNLMGTIVQRAGRVLVRVGGNSQETAAIVPEGLPNGTAIFKTEKTQFTPTLLLAPNLIYVMGNASSLVNIDWFIGLPFNDTENIRPLMAQLSQKVLGSHLVGMQLGNEPDLYHGNGIRKNTSYDQYAYFSEWGQVVAKYKTDPLVPVTNNFVAPSVCCGGGGGGWTPEQVFDTGFLDAYAGDLAYISVEHYPTNNCNISGILDPNTLLESTFLNHQAVATLSNPYINTAKLAQGVNKPFIMFETNTASCGGFSGLSDSFASALWSLDYNLNMAVNNFSNALYHVGGQRAYYNPFTPPPTNQTRFRQWTIGPTMYSTLVTAEAFGLSNKSQVVDLGVNDNNRYSPGYGIYEDGVPQRVVLMNFLTDPTGGSNYTAQISITGQTMPATVTVKYLLSSSTSEKWNITWAGQTFGGAYASDGRLSGDIQEYAINCDTANNFCPVTIPAPAAAIVFLNPAALKNSEPAASLTFSTSAATATLNTATIDPGVLATSNGRGGQNFISLGSTSPGSRSDAAGIRAGLATVLFALASGLLFIASSVVRN